MFRSAYIRKYLKKYLGRYLLGLVGINLVNMALVYLPRLIGDTTDGLAMGTYKMEDLWKTALFALIIGLCVFAGRMMWRIFFLGTSRLIEYDIRGDLFAHLETLSLRFYNENKSGDLMAYVVNDLNAVRNTLANGLITALDAVTMLTMVLYQMLTGVSISLTVLALIPMPLIAFASIKMRRLIHIKFREKQESFANLTDQVQESVSGIRVIKSFVQEEKEAEAFDEKAKDNYQKNMTLTRIMAVLEPIIGVITGISTLITLLYGGYLTMVGQISLGDFIAFIQYLLMLAGPLSGMGRCINTFSQGNASLARLETILNAKPDVQDLSTADPQAKVEGQITYDHLNFRYPNIHSFCRRYLRQARHRHDLSSHNYNKSGSCRQIHLPDIDLESGRSAQLLGIIRQRILCLGHAYRKIAVSCLRQLLEPCTDSRVICHAGSAVNLLGDGLDLLLQRHLIRIQWMIHRRLFLQGLQQFLPPSPPFAQTSESANAHPISRQRFSTYSVSSAVSVTKEFSVTTIGTPNF